jgi:hypothetical protein
MADTDKNDADPMVDRKIKKTFDIFGEFVGEIQFSSFYEKIISKIYHVYYPHDQDEEDLTFAEIKPFLVPSPTSAFASASPASAAAAASADMFAPVEKIEYIKK